MICSELLNCVDPEQFDVVHAHTLYSDGAAALRLKLQFGLPYVVAVRDTDLNVFMRFRPDLRWLMHSVLRNAAQLVFLSPTYREQFLSRLSEELRAHTADKTRVLGNGLGSFWFERGPTRRPDSNAPRRLLYVGDFSKRKNVQTLLRAVDRLRKRLPVELTLVGGGGNRDAQVRQSLERGEYPFAKFVCRIDDRKDLREIYRAHDIFVMPSLTETFGVVYLEALSQGLPVVHSRKQGLDGFFGQSRVSEAVDPRDIDDIARGIERLHERREEVGAACVAEARQFSWERIAEQYDELYQAAYHQ
jgi:glycosyltransferase involved in cell wall biosynthesis